MPFKALLKRQSIFWRAYEKSSKKTIRKRVVEDDTESIWIAVSDSAFEQPSIASDPLQLSETPLQQDCSEIYSEQVAEKRVIKPRTQETIKKTEELKTKEVDDKCPEVITAPKRFAERLKTQKIIPDIQGSYRCIECGKRFKLKDSYQRHMRIHTNERPFTCHVCAKQFRDSGGLSRHLKDVHAKVKNFSCDMCGKSFASKATREDHRRTHTGERPYICESCGNTFKSKASLYIHSKLHTDEFPHPCSYCNKKFRRRQEMLAHITTHTGEKNHTCDVCSKRFRVKSELVRHKLVHSEDKPFACNKCGLAFRQKRYLNNHIKSRHIDTLRNC